MRKEAKNIGIKVQLPKTSCEDKKCPFHGEITPRGRVFEGIVIAKDVHRTANVEWLRRISIPKYERFEKKRTKVHAHNSPCINAQIGDKVKIMECRPISKTKNFVIIENLGKLFGFEQIEEGREESKKIAKKDESKEKEFKDKEIKQTKVSQEKKSEVKDQ